MVFQHFSLFEALTVTENIALGLASAQERQGLRGRIVRVSTEYGLPLDPDRVVHDLSVGERQRIEIVRCLLQNPKLLIMDEPTSVLTPSEVQLLFATLRRLASEGCSILYISHKLEEVRALCSAATIMRLGRNVARCRPAEKTVKELAEIMINAELPAPTPRPARSGAAPPRLVLDRLTVRSPHPFGTDLRDVSLSLGRGRNPRHRRDRRQRAERADGRAVGRNPVRHAGQRGDRRHPGRAHGTAGAPAPARLLRAGGAQRARRGRRDVAGGERVSVQLPARRAGPLRA